MVSRLLLGYAVVELAAAFALVAAFGWGWTLLELLVASLLAWGVLAPMAGSHLVQRLGRVRSWPSGGGEPRAKAGDSAMITLAVGLVMIPGLVTTAVGLVLLAPPVRSVAAPGLAAIMARGLRRRVPLASYATAFATASAWASSDTYVGDQVIDAEVIDADVIDADVIDANVP
jgi:UPF0716 protein FxsA